MFLSCLCSPGRTGLSVVAAAAVIAAEPMPASFEKTPRATPYRIALIIEATILPQRPPPTAFAENAILKIIESPEGKLEMFPKITISPQIT